MTAFEPFGGMRRNPTEAVLARLPGRLAGRRLIRAVLPVDSMQAPAMVTGLVREHTPERLVLLGVAVGRAAVCLERRARNVLDFRFPDNGGHQPRGRAIVPGGSEVLSARFRVEEAVSALTSGLEVRLEASDDAGEFLCNQVYYHALRVVPPPSEVLFVHVPADEALAAELGPDRVPQGGAPLAGVVEAVSAVVGYGLSAPASGQAPSSPMRRRR